MKLMDWVFGFLWGLFMLMLVDGVDAMETLPGAKAILYFVIGLIWSVGIHAYCTTRVQ